LTERRFPLCTTVGGRRATGRAEERPASRLSSLGYLCGAASKVVVAAGFASRQPTPPSADHYDRANAGSDACDFVGDLFWALHRRCLRQLHGLSRSPAHTDCAEDFNGDPLGLFQGEFQREFQRV